VNPQVTDKKVLADFFYAFVPPGVLPHCQRIPNLFYSSLGCFHNKNCFYPERTFNFEFKELGS